MSTPTATTRARAPRGEGDRTRLEILEATRRLLLRHGDADQVSVRAIASEVGVTPPSIYRHFATKDDLLLATCEESFARLDEVSTAASEGADDPLDRLTARGLAYVRFGLDHPEQYRLLFMTRSTFATADAGERLRQTAALDHLVADVADAIGSGALRRDLDPVEVALVLWSTVHGITALRIAKPDFPWPPVEAVLATATAALLAGFGTQTV